KFDGSAYGYEFLAVDDDGNTYVTGDFNQTAKLDDKTITRNAGNTDVFDVFVAKLDKDGKVLWAEEFGGTRNEYVEDIALDSEGNTYITGTTEQSEGTDIFVAKFDKDGVSQWSKNFSNFNNNEASGIEVDKDGNTYLTGEFKSSLQFGDDTLTGGFEDEVFVTKLDSKGDVVWAKDFDNLVSGYSHEAADVVVDKEGNSYLFMDAGGEGTYKASVTKLNKSDGSEAWKKEFSSNSYMEAESIAIDSQDNIYIAGEFEETVSFGNTSLQGGEGGDVFVAKLDKSDGDVLWVKDFDSQNNDEDNVEVEGIAVDDMSNTYVTGYYNGKSMSVGNF
ncbi:MAG: SBBP repeat-containing protein, partial [Cyanobacteria bacterium J06643_5]